MKRVYAAAIAAATLLSAGNAYAVSDAVKEACKGDYHTFCDKMEVGSEELRSCMKTNATKLSKDCLKALVDNKEVTQADIDDYLKRMDEQAKENAAK